MQTLSVLVTTYGVPLIALLALVVWALADRPTKVSMVVAGAVALVVVGLLLLVSGAAWFDPRPFVVDGQAPLVPHPADNGFPSDHTTVAAAAAGVVAAYRVRAGAALLVLAALVGVSRVLVHVHHVPDVVGGWGFGVLAAAVGAWVAGLLAARLMRRWPRLAGGAVSGRGSVDLERTPTRTMAS